MRRVLRRHDLLILCGEQRTERRRRFRAVVKQRPVRDRVSRRPGRFDRRVYLLRRRLCAAGVVQDSRVGERGCVGGGQVGAVGEPGGERGVRRPWAWGLGGECHGHFSPSGRRADLEL